MKAHFQQIARPVEYSVQVYDRAPEPLRVAGFADGAIAGFERGGQLSFENAVPLQFEKSTPSTQSTTTTTRSSLLTFDESPPLLFNNNAESFNALNVKMFAPSQT